MKWKLAFLGLVAAANVLQADINDDTYSGSDASINDEQLSPGEDRGPFTIRTSFDCVGKAKINEREFRGDKFRFCEFDVDGTYVVYYDKCRKEGISLEAGYSYFNLDWHQNPYFSEDDFNMVSVGVNFFTQRAFKWDWRAAFKMNLNPSHMDLQKYVTWDMLVWGRYELATDWGFHAGVLALTGMKIDRVYPILGVDWRINDQWKVNAIFPMNFSVIYTVDCNWSVALASRFWDVRQRVGAGENLSRATWEYRNFGGELAVNYHNDGLNLNVHAGYTTGGRLNIADRHKHHTKRIKFDGAPYVGAEAGYNF